MKHLNIYESFSQPKLQDYAICIKPTEAVGDLDKHTDIFTKYLVNTIGVISNVKGRNDDGSGEPIFPYTVYYNIEDEKIKKLFVEYFNSNFELDFSLTEIMWDSNIETLKLKIEANKYNI